MEILRPTLLAVVLASRDTIVARGPQGEREIAADGFFVDLLETALAVDKVITWALGPCERVGARAPAHLVSPARHGTPG